MWILRGGLENAPEGYFGKGEVAFNCLGCVSKHISAKWYHPRKKGYFPLEKHIPFTSIGFVGIFGPLSTRPLWAVSSKKFHSKARFFCFSK